MKIFLTFNDIEDENVTNRGNIKINPTNEITGIWKLTKQLIYEIQPLLSGISHNILIKIYGEEAITYELFWNYMASKINDAYVENDSVEGHLRAIRSNGIITT